MPGLSFTSRSQSLSNRLMCKVFVLPHNPARMGCKLDRRELGKEFIAQWDTGASGSVLSKELVTALKLVPISYAKAVGANGPYDTGVYYIDLFLPNHRGICKLKVTDGNFQGADILIGMDIISQGDFSVTNFNGKTTFSFRMPSLHEVDYVTKSYLDPYKKAVEPGRNDPCPCESGKKYKDCCLLKKR